MKTNKKRIANYLKLGILLFGISVLLWNCEKEEVLSLPENNTTVSHISLKDLKEKEHLSKLFEKIEPRFKKTSKISG